MSIILNMEAVPSVETKLPPTTGWVTTNADTASETINTETVSISAGNSVQIRTEYPPGTSADCHLI